MLKTWPWYTAINCDIQVICLCNLGNKTRIYKREHRLLKLFTDGDFMVCLPSQTACSVRCDYTPNSSASGVWGERTSLPPLNLEALFLSWARVSAQQPWHPSPTRDHRRRKPRTQTTPPYPGQLPCQPGIPGGLSLYQYRNFPISTAFLRCLLWWFTFSCVMPH